MATASCKITIDGIDLHPYHVALEQRTDWHHQFEVTITSAKAIQLGSNEEAKLLAVDDAVACIGKELSIHVNRLMVDLLFLGVITDVRVDHTYAGDAHVVFSGFSPTYFLDGLPSVQTWENAKLGDLVNSVLKAASMKGKVKPRYPNKIPYVTRFRESQYNFLSRLASDYGEWFYYDGQQIIFGEPIPQKKKIALNFGGDSMLSFNYGVRLDPQDIGVQWYDYENNKDVKESVPKTPSWAEHHAGHAARTSGKLFKEKTMELSPSQADDSGHFGKIRKHSRIGNAVVFNGQSADPRIRPGSEIEFKSKTSVVGSYRILHVNHTVTSDMDYYNSFVAVPLGVSVPPENKGIVRPEAEAQIAKVVDIKDPEKLGRVRVQFRWQKEGEKTPWIRVLAAHAGSKNGHYFVPEMEDEVYVDFEQGNPDHPFVMGSKYHGKSKPEHFDEKNNVKAIYTRSGHKLLFDDSNGEESITIEDKNGNKVKLDTSKKSILISSKSSVTVKSGNITIDATKNVTIKAKENIKIEAGQEVSIEAGTEALVSGGTKAKLDCGGSKVEFSPVECEIKGAATLKASAGAMVEVKGALIKLN